MTATSTLPRAGSDVASGQVVAAAKLAVRYGALLLLAVYVLVLSVMETDAFLSVDNARSTLNGIGPTAILAIAVTVPLMVREFDLTAVSLVGAAGAYGCWLMSVGDWHWVAAIGVTFAGAGALGVVVGALVARLPGTSFILTLGVGSVLGGLELWRSQGAAITTDLPAGFLDLGTGSVARVQIAPIVAAGLVAVSVLVLRWTSAGPALRAVGDDREAARSAGVRTRRVVVSTFVASGVGAALAGQFVAAKAGGYFPIAGQGLLLPVFTAAFLGAALSRHGWFSPAASAGGAIYLAIIGNGLDILAVPEWSAHLVQGVILLVAMILAYVERRWGDAA